MELTIKYTRQGDLTKGPPKFLNRSPISKKNTIIKFKVTQIQSATSSNSQKKESMSSKIIKTMDQRNEKENNKEK